MVWAWMLCHRMLFEHKRYYGLGMDAVVEVYCWNTNIIMFWAWALWSPSAFGTRTLLWFGHGCSCDRMLLEHERYYGMDALVTACSVNVSVSSPNTNVIMVWAWMLWLSLFWFGHGCYGEKRGRIGVVRAHSGQRRRRETINKQIGRAQIASRSLRVPPHRTANVRSASKFFDNMVAKWWTGFICQPG